MSYKLKLFTTIFILFSLEMFCQFTDTITIHIDVPRYKEEATQNFDARYQFTSDSLVKLTQKYNPEGWDFLVRYPKDEIEITTIPIFKFKDLMESHKQLNAVNWIDFTNNFEKQNFNLYYKDSLLLDTSIELSYNNSYDEVFYMLTTVDYNIPRFGNLSGYMYKLSLEKKHFTFLLEEFPPDTFFIIREGKIYAVYFVKDQIKQTEINKYFSKMLKKNVHSKTPTKSILILKDRAKSSKVFNENYYIKAQLN